MLHDDFMISERYARNLAQGRGLVFNPGERVEGFSDPLTVLGVCLPLEALHVEGRKLGLFVWSVNGAFAALIVLCLAFGPVPRSHLYGLAAGLVYLTLPHHGFFARAGLEVYVQALCLLIVVARLREGGAAFYFALALLPLAHSIDLPLWLGAALLRLALERRRWRTEAAALLLASLPLTGYFAFRLAYYQELFPNTYLLKSGGILAPMRGLRYLLHGASWIAPILALLGIGLAKAGKGAWLPLCALALIFGPYLLFVAKVGGDNFEWHRLVFILVPALVELVTSLFASLRGGTWAALFFAGSGLQIGANLYGYWLADAENRSLLAWDRARVALGYGILENTEPTQTVALFGLGNAAYFGERYTIDMLGKTDAHIARTEPNVHRRVGHQKDDPDYVMSRRPDFVEMPYSTADLLDLDRLKQDRQGRWGYFANLALHPVFRREYSPVPSDRGEIPMYVRNDLLPQRWVVLPELAARWP